MPRPLNDDELVALIEQEEANCLSTTSGKLAEQRRQAMQYYYGEPYGNEVEGRSQVVTTEVKDAVEGILPSLMAIFTSNDEVVRFEPQNPDDEEVAQQATDYINYVFSRLNNGVLALYCLFKDALLLKNGFLKVYWENYEDQAKESYEGLSDDEFFMLAQDPELELVQHDLVQSPTGPTHTAVFKRTKKYGHVCIDPVPPEEVLISRETPNDLTKARFVEHRTRKTISDIREMGYAIDDDIADYAPNADFNMERVERNKFDDAFAFSPDKANDADPSTRAVWFCECYLKVDFDGDGLAEFRKVSKVGRKILDNVEFDSHCIVGGTAVMMPHKFFGLSIHDLVGDIQLIKSTVTRQLLDNAYNANNGRYEALDGMVNMDDLLTNRPGGIVRVKTLGAVKRLDTPLLGQPAFGLLEYFDKVKQNRVGITDFPNAVDPDALNQKATVAEIYKSAAMERVQLMARILAEGPVKDLFWKILELVSKHEQKPRMVKLRGQWVKVDPREWHNRFNLTVTVGLGTGSQQTTLNGAMGIMQIQQQMAQAGLMGVTLTPTNIYNAAVKYAKATFPKDADAFFANPATLPPKPQQPNPEILKIQLAAQKAAMGNKQKYDKMMLDYKLALQQMGIDISELAMTERMHREDVMHEHIQGSLDRGVDLAMHRDEIHNRPEKAPSEA